MSILSCCGVLKALSRAAAKNASGRLRALGLLPSRIDWQRRAEICERCPLRVIVRGVSHCGRPYLEQVDRDESLEGCGCPTIAKSKDPSEHCPVTPRMMPAARLASACTCKWCVLAGRSTSA